MIIVITEGQKDKKKEKKKDRKKNRKKKKKRQKDRKKKKRSIDTERNRGFNIVMSGQCCTSAMFKR